MASGPAWGDRYVIYGRCTVLHLQFLDYLSSESRLDLQGLPKRLCLCVKCLTEYVFWGLNIAVAVREPHRHNLKGTHPMGSRKKIGCLEHFTCVQPLQVLCKSLLSPQGGCHVKLVRLWPEWSCFIKGAGVATSKLGHSPLATQAPWHWLRIQCVGTIF